MNLNRLMTIFEAAEYLGVSQFSLRKMARDGSVPAGKVGKQWRFRGEDLNAFIQKQYRSDSEQ